MNEAQQVNDALTNGLLTLEQIHAIEDKDTRMQHYVNLAERHPEAILLANAYENFEADDFRFFNEALIPLIQVVGCEVLGGDLVNEALLKRPMDFMVMPERYRIKFAVDAFLTGTYNLVRLMRQVDDGIDVELTEEIQALCEHAACIPRHHIRADNCAMLHAILPKRVDLIPDNLRTTEFWLESIARFGETSVPYIDASAWTKELMEAVGDLSVEMIERVPPEARDVEWTLMMITHYGHSGVHIEEEYWMDDRIFNDVLSNWELLKLVPSSAITPARAMLLIEAYAPDIQVLQYFPESAYSNQVAQEIIKKFKYGIKYCNMDNVSLSIVEDLVRQDPKLIMHLPATVIRSVTMANHALSAEPALIAYIPRPTLEQLDLEEFDIPLGLWHFIPPELMTVTDANVEAMIKESPMTLAIVPWTKFTTEQKKMLAGNPNAETLLNLAQR